MHLEVCISNVISDPVGLLETYFRLLIRLLFFFFFKSIGIYYSDKKNVLKPQEWKRGILSKWQPVVWIKLFQICYPSIRVKSDSNEAVMMFT